MVVDARSRLPVQRFRGCLAMRCGDDAVTCAQVRELLDRHHARHGVRLEATDPDGWHITLVTKDELRGLDQQTIEEALALPTRFFVIGLGGSHPRSGPNAADGDAAPVLFAVCVWPRAQAFRQKLGLPLKDFHITLSPARTNVHTIDKTFTSLLDPTDALNTWLGVEALEALSRQLLLEAKHEAALTVATRLCDRFSKETSRGWIRLGDAAAALGKSKLAMLSYGAALDNGCDESLEQYALMQLVQCASTSEWGHLFQEHEQDEIPCELESTLVDRPWSSELKLRIQDHARFRSPLTLPTRERLHVPSLDGGRAGFYRLPRFFRWVVPFHLSSMSTPLKASDIEYLATTLGIRHIVTLTEEQPLPAEWFASLPSIENTFLPIPNYKAPTMEQVDIFIKICLRARGAVMVHCGGGKGRAGTMLACYLVAFGFQKGSEDWQHPAMTAAEAIDNLRIIRPGSVETSEQEQAVSRYASWLWKRQSVLPAEISEPFASRPVFEGRGIETSDLLVLCGLPGSGKTSFRKALLKRALAAASPHSPSWIVLSGDEHGRQSCENSIGGKGIQRAILDRCNADAADRAMFLSLASTWCKHPTAVWFDFPVELCTYRAQNRADNAALPPGGRVRAAIAHHQQRFIPPSLAEGFQTIVRLTSTEAALELARMLTPALEIYKYPRTPHLFNVGAATEDDIILQENSVPPSGSAFASDIVLTEKVDGANMGISIGADGSTFIVQNRSHYVTSKSHAQFRRLDWFLETYREDLRAILCRDVLFPERFILFGEWLAATHSIPYSRLRSYFYAFDLYDRERGCFVTRRQLEQIMQSSRIPLTPRLWEGTELPSREDLLRRIQRQSEFYDGPVEGVYIKWEQHGMVRERAKVVRADFITGNEHWTRGPLRLNHVLPTW